MNSSLNKEVVFFGKSCLEIYIIAKVKVTKKTRKKLECIFLQTSSYRDLLRSIFYVSKASLIEIYVRPLCQKRESLSCYNVYRLNMRKGGGVPLSS